VYGCEIARAGAEQSERYGITDKEDMETKAFILISTSMLAMHAYALFV
jgi:hypothetical protein